MGTFNDFIDSQKIIYELKAEGDDSSDEEDDGYPYDRQDLYYQEGVATREEEDIPFVRLMEGKEPLCNMKRRYVLYKKNWSRQLTVINEILATTDRDKFEELGRFLFSGEDPKKSAFLNFKGKDNWRIPCALLNLGSNIANLGRLLDQVNDFLSSKDTVIVRLSTATSSSVKACLKAVSFGIAAALEHEVEDSDSEEEASDEGGFQGSSYYAKNVPDFEVLIRKLAQTDKKLVVLIEDADSLPTNTMNQLFRSLWHASTETQNVYLVVGISMPLIIFQEKLPRLVLNVLRTRNFQIDNSNQAISQIMGNLLLNINDTYNSLIFEPRLVLFFLQRKSIISISQLYNYMKLIYMNHYFSQPLSILWTDNFSGIDLTNDYFEVFKRLPSVRTGPIDVQGADVTTLDFYKSVSSGDDDGVGPFLRSNLNKLINWRFNLKNMIDFLNLMQDTFYDLRVWKNNLDLFQLIFQHYDYDNEYDNMTNFEFLKPIYLNMCSVDVDNVNRFVDLVNGNEHFSFVQEDDHEQLAHVKKRKDVQKLCRELDSTLLHHLTELNLDRQPFKEICCIGMDACNLLTNAFNPAVRDVEMDAMLNSKAYLLNGVHTDPATLDPEGNQAQLYKLFEPSMIEIFRLYREAGVVINIYDFYQAFAYGITNRRKLCTALLERLSSRPRRTKEEAANIDTLRDILELDNTEPCEEWDKLTLSWFLKGLVELELKGLLKEGRNASETLEKVVWKGI